ncbi:SapB/AmfS family lanthipeptide [Streptomyces sp. NPDC059070]
MVLLDLQTLAGRDTGPAEPGRSTHSAASVFFCPSSITVILCLDEPRDDT